MKSRNTRLVRGAKLSALFFCSLSIIFTQLAIDCGTALGVPAKKNAKKEVKFKRIRPEPSGLPIGKIESALSHKDVDGVLKLLAQTPVKPADSDVRHVIMAACLSLRKDHEKSIAEFEKAKRIMQAGDHALCRVARAYANEQDFDKAIELCGIGIKRSNDDEALTLRADCYVSQQRYPLAIADYEELARANPEYCKRYRLKASRVLVICGKFEEALAQADAALKCPGGDTDASSYLTRVQCLEKLKRWPEAVIAATKAIEIARADKHASSEVFITTAIEARARFYDKMGKASLAAADRRVLDKYSKSIMSDLVGDK